MSTPNVYGLLNKLYVSSDNGKTWETKDIVMDDDIKVTSVSDAVYDYPYDYIIANDYYVLYCNYYDNDWYTNDLCNNNTHKLINFINCNNNIIACSSDGYMFYISESDIEDTVNLYEDNTDLQVFEITHMDNDSNIIIPLCGKNGYISVIITGSSGIDDTVFNDKIDNINWTSCCCEYRSINLTVDVWACAENGYVTYGKYSATSNKIEYTTTKICDDNLNDIAVYGASGLYYIVTVGDNGQIYCASTNNLNSDGSLIWTKVPFVDDSGITYTNNLNKIKMSNNGYNAIICGDNKVIQINSATTIPTSIILEYAIDNFNFIFYNTGDSISKDGKKYRYNYSKDINDLIFDITAIQYYSIVRKILYNDGYYYALIEKINLNSTDNLEFKHIKECTNEVRAVTSVSDAEMEELKNMHYYSYHEDVIAKSTDLTYWTVIISGWDNNRHIIDFNIDSDNKINVLFGNEIAI